MTDNQAIKDEIIRIMDKGGLDKHQIFTIVSLNLKIARPTIKRVARDLRIELEHKLQVLQE